MTMEVIGWEPSEYHDDAYEARVLHDSEVIVTLLADENGNWCIVPGEANDASAEDAVSNLCGSEETLALAQRAAEKKLHEIGKAMADADF